MILRSPLLIEIGTEELPPKALNELAQAFREGVVTGLQKRSIGFDAAGARALWTPRRLAVLIDAVEHDQPDQHIERRGPALNAGLDAQGKPTKALAGFAQSCGVTVDALARLETDKGAWFVYRSVKPGVATRTLVPEIVLEALNALPIPKPMRWGDREESFVRPVHWVVLLLGDKVCDGTVLGVKVDRFTRGHRFHHTKPVWIGSPADYVDALRAARVIVDPQARRALIREQVDAAASKTGGGARMREELLDEVNNLVEWPQAIACTFDRAFLAVPQEALITTMEANQKFFPVFDANGKLTEHFIGVANVQSSNPAEIRKGYERVIRPRFADAKFFFDDDLKTPLAQHQTALQKVTYQQKLGSVWEKCTRVAELARVIAGRIGVDAAAATRAAALAKCDLMTRMVGEFPELQGIMGRYYASAQGEKPDIAAALEEFYAPRFAGDATAASPIGQVLAIAEKIDTLTGLFAVGQKPSGNKDPFSLRRTALGLARTLIERKLDLDVTVLFREALEFLGESYWSGKPESGAAAKGKPATPPSPRDALHARIDELYEFVLERLRGYYAEQGVSTQVFNAVAALRPASLVDFDARLRGMVEFAKLPEAEALAAANKRIGNILRQAAEKGDKPAPHIDATALTEPEERALAAALGFHGDTAKKALAKRDYVGALKALAQVRGAVDGFFDKVMVMVDDADVRHNRLAVLHDLQQRFLAIADIALLQAG